VVRKIITGALVGVLLAGTASADTLREALVSTYQTNPTLTAQRENLKATDATVAIARSAGRPQISRPVALNRELTRRCLINTSVSMGPKISVLADLCVPF
jgi:outer membrane protein